MLDIKVCDQLSIEGQAKSIKINLSAIDKQNRFKLIGIQTTQVSTIALKALQQRLHKNDHVI